MRKESLPEMRQSPAWSHHHEGPRCNLRWLCLQPPSSTPNNEQCGCWAGILEAGKSAQQMREINFWVFSTFCLFTKWSSLEGLLKSAHPASIVRIENKVHCTAQNQEMCLSWLNSESWVLSLCAVLGISMWPQDQRPRDGGELCLVLHSLHIKQAKKDIVTAQGNLQISKGED